MKRNSEISKPAIFQTVFITVFFYALYNETHRPHLLSVTTVMTRLMCLTASNKHSSYTLFYVFISLNRSPFVM